MDDVEQAQQATIDRSEPHHDMDEDDDGGSSSSSSSSEDSLSDDGNEAEQLALIEKLEASLSENPCNYQAHIELISLLRKCGLLDKLRSAREAMSAIFPLTPAMWQEWTQDEARLISSVKDVPAVEALYERGLAEYLSVQLWLEYLEFERQHDPDVMQYNELGISKMRSLYERALTSASLHYTEGVKIWTAYRLFEIDVLNSLNDTTEEAKAKQVDCIRSLYRRQLCVPLCNSSMTMKEYVEWEAKQGFHIGRERDDLDGIPINVASAYRKAEQMSTTREPYERKISKEKPKDAELLQNYLDYISLEEGTGDPARVQVLYERAIVDFPITPDVWLKYVDYLEKNLKVSRIILSVYGRAVRNCPWVQTLWGRYLLAMERSNASEPDLEKIFNQSLQSGFPFSTPEEYLEHYLIRVDGIRRHICSLSADPEKQSLLLVLREVFSQGAQFLSTYFPDFKDRSFRLHSYWARLEANLGNDVVAARGIWENIIKSSGWMVDTWKEYIAFELSLKNHAEVRTLYKRCYSRRLEGNGTEVICQSWLQFEREYGTLEDYDRAISKVIPRLEEVKQLQQQQDAKAATTAARDLKGSSQEKQKSLKKTKQTPDSKKKAVSEPKKRSFESDDVDGKSTKRVKVVATDGSGIDVGGSGDRDSSAPPLEEPKHKTSLVSDNLKYHRDECTAFISRIASEVTEEDLRHFFSSCGGLKEVRLMKDRKTGQSRGFAYIDFENEEGLSAAIAKHNQKLKGEKLRILRSDPALGHKKGAIQQRYRDDGHHPNKKKTDGKAGEGMTDSKDGQSPEEKSKHEQKEVKVSEKGTTENVWSKPLKTSSGPGGRLNPVSALHRRGGHIQITGKNTFALPRSVVRPLGFSGGQVKDAGQEEPPKSNKDFRDMLLKH